MNQRHMRIQCVCMLAVLAGMGWGALRAAQIGPVFVIAMENHNWTQPGGGDEQIFGNAAAPYINSLVTPGHVNAQYVSYASHMIQAISPVTLTTSHPSESNYIWSEAGTDFGIDNDNDPYGYGGSNQNMSLHLSGLLQAKGISWTSYQEDTQLQTTNGGNINNSPVDGVNTLTNTVALPSQYTVPLTSFSGSSPTYVNAYNGSHQYDYAAKHNPQVFFTDTNGGDDATTGNPLAAHYAPLERLQGDLISGQTSNYNWITPNQFNDMHTPLDAGFTRDGIYYTDGLAQIAQGDHFLSVIVPLIMASNAFQNQNATIIIWNDETEGESLETRGDYASMEIVISKLAKGNAYNSTLTYTHSSDLRTMQELFGLWGPGGYLGDTGGVANLSDMFQPGAIPEPATLVMLGLGVAGVVGEAEEVIDVKVVRACKAQRQK